MSRAVVEARSTSGKAGDPARSVRITHYDGGWDVAIAIGGRDPARRAAAKLEPGQARAVAGELLAAAERAERAYRVAVGGEE